MLFMAIVIPAAVEALHVASLAGEVAARKGVAARIADRVLNESIVTTNWSTGTQKRKRHRRRRAIPLDAEQPELARGHDAIAHGRGEIFGAGPRLFGHVKHAGEFADVAHDHGKFALMKINQSNTRAFTLIEMILAVGVASLVLAVIGGVFFTALHLRKQRRRRWTERRRWTRRWP